MKKFGFFYLNLLFLFKLLAIVFFIALIIIKFKVLNAKESDKIDLNNIKKSNIIDNKSKFNVTFFWNDTLLKNEMHDYRLYNIFKIPFISIILFNNKNDKQDLTNKIKYITSQNFSNFEIILYIENGKNDLDKIYNEFNGLIKENILRICNVSEDFQKVYTKIINIINGIYTIFIDDYNLLQYFQFESILNKIKGRIDNYFRFFLSNCSDIYILKSKVLKELIDTGNKFNSLDGIIQKVCSFQLPQVNYIPICFCPDNSYTSLTYVSMISILSSKSPNTYICFFLIIPPNFDNKNINFLYSLYNEYEYFNITVIHMDNRYEKAYSTRIITKQAYYRLSLGELLPNWNKAIYFDSDIIVYKDLTKFFSLNFNGKMILGHPTIGNRNTQKFGLYQINTGILLLNLLEMRKIKFEKKVIDIIQKGGKFDFYDQTLLNENFKQYIGIFPPEYHTRPWSNYSEMEIFNYKIGNIFDQDYFYFAHKYPTIRHFLGRYKAKNRITNHVEDWWFYARKSKYYNSNASDFHFAFSF